MKLDFKLYTEKPKEPKEFLINKKTKERYKKIFFIYHNKTEVVFDLSEYEYKVWRANFPMQNVTTKKWKKKH